VNGEQYIPFILCPLLSLFRSTKHITSRSQQKLWLPSTGGNYADFLVHLYLQPKMLTGIT